MRSEDQSATLERVPEKNAAVKSAELKVNAIKAEKAEKAGRDEVLTEALEESFPASDPIPTMRTTKSGF